MNSYGFVQERGFDRSEVAELTGWLAFAGGILGNLFGGVGGDAFFAQNRHGPPDVFVLDYVGIDSADRLLTDLSTQHRYFSWLVFF